MKSLSVLVVRGLMVVSLAVGAVVFNNASAQAKKPSKKVNTVKKVDTDSILVPPPPPPATPRKVKPKVRKVMFTPPVLVKDSIK